MRFRIRPIGPLAAFALVLTGWFAGTNTSQAAPQLLALVNTDGAVELRCHGRECWAQFSVFCLQPDRQSPVQGTKYDLAAGSEIALTGIARGGHRVTLDAREFLKVESERTHVAVRLSMDRRDLDRLGIERVEVAVGEDVTLLPRPVPGDDMPQSEAEIVVASSSLRKLGSQIVDSNGDRMVAARATGRMINALPPGGRVARKARQSLWRQTVGEAGQSKLPAAAGEMVRNVYDFCDYGVTYAGFPSLRKCLESQHDGFLGYLNNRYWDAVKTGS